MKIRPEFKIQDMWFGVYWETKIHNPPTKWESPVFKWDIWICILPTLPIHLSGSHVLLPRNLDH